MKIIILDSCSNHENETKSTLPGTSQGYLGSNPDLDLEEEEEEDDDEINVDGDESDAYEEDLAIDQKRCRYKIKKIWLAI